MRHRIKAGKVCSFTPEKRKEGIEQQENREIHALASEHVSVSEEVEEIFEEDTEFRNDDEALAAMEFYDTPDEME